MVCSAEEVLVLEQTLSCLDDSLLDFFGLHCPVMNVLDVFLLDVSRLDVSPLLVGSGEVDS